MNNEAKFSRSPEYYEEMKRRDRNKLILSVIAILIFAGAVTGLILGVFVSPFVVTGPSMKPTLVDGQRIFVLKTMYTPEVGDIIVFKSPENGDKLIKRVMAVPGDSIKASRSGSSSLYVNGVPVHNHYFNYAGFEKIDDVDMTLGDNEYFLMGDNYIDSKDSRVFGVVNKNLFIGKCVTRTNADK